MVLETPFVVGMATEAMLTVLLGVIMFVSPWTNIVTMILCQNRRKDAITKLCRCLVEIKMKVEIEDGHGESKGQDEGGCSHHALHPDIHFQNSKRSKTVI